MNDNAFAPQRGWPRRGILALILVIGCVAVASAVLAREKVVGDRGKDGAKDVIQRPSGGAVTYTYDSVDRLIRADYENGTVIEYEYDLVGNMTKCEVRTRTK